MTSCTNEEPRYFGTNTCHVKANTFSIETMGVYVPPRVPLLIGRCRPSKRMSRWEACEQTTAPAVREACEQTVVPADREACDQTTAQAHREASPLTRLHRPPSSQLLPLLMSSAPQLKINPALPGIATIFSLPLRFSCRLPPTSLT